MNAKAVAVSNPRPNKNNVRKYPNITNMYIKIRQNIIGQDEALRKVILAIYRGLEIPSIKSNILIIGPSGVGKTESMKQIAYQLRIPYTIEDATKYTQEGYVGNSVNSMIYNLYCKADKNARLAENGMLIIDEIDKKATNRGQEQVAGREVLNSLLKIIEGSRVPIKESSYSTEPNSFVNTSKMIVVCMGAFEGLEKIREARLKNKSEIGFSTGKNVALKNQDARYTKEDLIKFGLTPEFVGRINTIVEYKQLSEEKLVEIVKSSKLSVFKCYEKYFLEKGIRLNYTEDIFTEIVKKAVTAKTGAREISNVVNEMFEEILYDVLSAYGRKYTKCILKPELVNNPCAYELK